MEILDKLGIDLGEVTQLEDEGVEEFVASYGQLMEALQERIEACASSEVSGATGPGRGGWIADPKTSHQ